MEIPAEWGSETQMNVFAAPSARLRVEDTLQHMGIFCQFFIPVIEENKLVNQAEEVKREAV